MQNNKLEPFPFEYEGNIIPDMYDITHILLNEFKNDRQKVYEYYSKDDPNCIKAFIDTSKYTNWDIFAIDNRPDRLADYMIYILYNGNFYIPNMKENHNTFPPELCVIETKANLSKLKDKLNFYYVKINNINPYVIAPHKIISYCSELYFDKISYTGEYTLMVGQDICDYDGDILDFAILETCKYYNKYILLSSESYPVDDYVCECDKKKFDIKLEKMIELNSRDDERDVKYKTAIVKSLAIEGKAPKKYLDLYFPHVNQHKQIIAKYLNEIDIDKNIIFIINEYYLPDDIY